MINKKGIALAAMLLTLTITAPLMAQRRNGNDAQKSSNGPDAYAPKPGSAEEAKAFNAIATEQDPAKKVTLGDQFMTTYPSSPLKGQVQRLRMDGLMKQRQYKLAAAAAEDGLALETKYMEDLIAKADDQAKNSKDKKSKDKDKNEVVIDKNSDGFKAFADNTEKVLMYYYQNLMQAYQALNDAPKAVEWGQKALGQDPDDVTALLTVSSIMAARPKDDKGGFDQKDAETLSKKALARLNTVLNGPMGAQLRPEDKAEMMASAHETVGKVYFNTKKYPDAEREFGAAIVAKKDEGDAYFFMGMSLSQDKGKIDDVMENLAKAVYLKGPTQAQADSVLKDLYQKTKKSMDGYDDYVKTAGSKIGK